MVAQRKMCKQGFSNRCGKQPARVADGMAIGQAKLMDGADAPVQWRAGNHQQVMDYVMGDCQMTNLIVRSILDAGEIRWKTSKGTIRSEPMPTLKTVQEVIADPAPDQSWMDRPLLKETFYDWIPATGACRPFRSSETDDTAEG